MQENTDGWFIMMHPQLVAGARVGFNDKVTMGSWGQGARSALPIVGEVFQQALRNRWIDTRAEFARGQAATRARARTRAAVAAAGGSVRWNHAGVAQDLSVALICARCKAGS